LQESSQVEQEFEQEQMQGEADGDIRANVASSFGGDDDDDVAASEISLLSFIFTIESLASDFSSSKD